MLKTYLNKQVIWFLMSRNIDDKTILDKFTEDFTRIAEKHTRYAIVGGFIAIVHGRSRGTEDIDMIIEKLPKDRFILLHNDLANNNFECIQSENPETIYEYLENKDSVRYIKKGQFVPEMEIKFAKDLLDQHVLNTRIKIPETKLDVYFANIEATIAFKEELLGSDKDMEDAKHLRILYKNNLKEKEIDNLKREIRRMRLGKR